MYPRLCDAWTRLKSEYAGSRSYDRTQLNRHFFPDAAFFFPIVKRLSVDLVNGSLCHLHAARLSGQKEINIIRFAVSGFHIDAGKVFAPTETRKRIVMNPNQIEGEIFAPIVDMKLLVAGFLAAAVNVFFDPDRDIGLAHFFCLSTALRRCCYYLCVWQPLHWCSKPANWLRVHPRCDAAK